MAILSYISVFVLFLINLLNYMDRFTVAGVLTKIKDYYSLNDKQSGLLQTAFIVCYMIFAPIFGYLGDRYSRKWIMIFGVMFWSLTTFLGSFIPKEHPILFFIMRALVGTGEASYSTIAPTIIADMFAPVMRTKMLGLFYFAIPVGSGLGYIVGSSVASAMDDWKWALRVTPPLGIVSAVLVFLLVCEPKRGESDNADEQQERTTLMADLLYLTTVRSYIWSTIGFTCISFAVGALSWWAPTYMKYAYEMSKNPKSDEWIGLIFGIIACIGGIIGVVIGVSGSHYYKLYNPRADPLICAAGVVVSIPSIFLCLYLAHRSAGFSWFFVFIGITFLSTNWSVVADMLLYVITPGRRSLAQSIQILVSHLFGDASSPFIIGFISDILIKDRNSEEQKYWYLQYSLYITPFVLVIGGFAFFYTSLFIVSDKELCKTQTQGLRSRNTSETSIHTLPPRASNHTIEVNGDIESYNTLIDSDSKFLLYSN